MGNEQGKRGGGRPVGTRQQQPQPRASQQSAQPQRQLSREGPSPRAAAMAAAAEGRLQKKKVKKKSKQQTQQERWEAYQAIGKEEVRNEWEEKIREQEARRAQSLPSSSSSPAAAAAATTATTSKSGKLNCPFCSEKFTQKADILRHMEMAHPDDPAGQARLRRAEQAEARMRAARTSKKKGKQELADEHWEQYKNIEKKLSSNKSVSPESRFKNKQLLQAYYAFSENPPDQQRESGKMLRNVLKKLAVINPDEKYRRLKLSNQKVDEKIVKVPGALDILHVCGFSKMSLPNPTTMEVEEYLYCEVPDSEAIQIALNELDAGLQQQQQ